MRSPRCPANVRKVYVAERYACMRCLHLVNLADRIRAKSITVSRGMWTTCGKGHRKLNRALGMHAVTAANIRMADGRVVVTLERQPSVHRKEAKTRRL